LKEEEEEEEERRRDYYTKVCIFLCPSEREERYRGGRTLIKPSALFTALRMSHLSACLSRCLAVSLSAMKSLQWKGGENHTLAFLAQLCVEMFSGRVSRAYLSLALRVRLRTYFYPNGNSSWKKIK
jgi:hypothetical protein